MFVVIANGENRGVSSSNKAWGDACRYSSWLHNLLFCLSFKFATNAFYNMVNVCLIIIFAEAFAVVREAAIRKLGMRHFDVQVSVLYTHNHAETHVLLLHLYSLKYVNKLIYVSNFNDRLLVERCFMMGLLPR